jgi:hypothetical protein
MKTRYLIAALLLFGFVAQAQKGFAPTANLNKPFVLGLSEQISIKPIAARLLFVQVLKDSRCPINAKCVSAGDAEVQFLYWKPKAVKSQMISLHTAKGKNTIKLGAQSLILVDLQPGKVAGVQKPLKYRVTLKMM